MNNRWKTLLGSEELLRTRETFDGVLRDKSLRETLGFPIGDSGRNIQENISQHKTPVSKEELVRHKIKRTASEGNSLRLQYSTKN